jgi:hypothetical protein
MSALGQKRKFAPQNVMSALFPKADMCGATRDVRYRPIADIVRCTAVRGRRSVIYVFQPRQGCGPLESPRLHGPASRSQPPPES